MRRKARGNAHKKKSAWWPGAPGCRSWCFVLRRRGYVSLCGLMGWRLRESCVASIYRPCAFSIRTHMYLSNFCARSPFSARALHKHPFVHDHYGWFRRAYADEQGLCWNHVSFFRSIFYSYIVCEPPKKNTGRLFLPWSEHVTILHFARTGCQERMGTTAAVANGLCSC